MKRKWPLRVPCTHPGCTDVARYEYDTRRDLEASWELKNRATYKCSRHSNTARVLSMQNLRTEWISAPNRQEPYGRFIGSSGVLIGHGYYMEAKDFPVGARLKITCEVLLPEDDAIG